MMLLVSGATKTMRNYRGNANLGHLLTPDNRNDPRTFHQPWAADNAAFTGFKRERYLSMLDKIAAVGLTDSCLWVTAPDVVADADATLALFEEWEPELSGRGFRVALVAQDGLTPERTPWERLDCLFIGGGTEWKLGVAAAELMAEAKARGKWVHIGRVNTMERLDYAMRCGADSVDGTAFSMYPATHIPWALSQIKAFKIQPDMFAA